MNWNEVPRSLQLKYLRAAAITAAQLGSLVEKVERDSTDREPLKLMLRRFYGLAAWAGLYGLAAISVAAQLGAHDCSTLAGSRVMPQPAHVEQIRALVDVLRQAIYRQRTTGGISEEILWASPSSEDLRSAVPLPLPLSPPWRPSGAPNRGTPCWTP